MRLGRMEDRTGPSAAGPTGAAAPIEAFRGH